MFITYLEFNGITASITTNWDVHHDFINLYLQHFVSSPVKEPDLDIYSMFPNSWDDAPVSPPFSHENMRKLGPDVLFDEHRIYNQRGNLKIFVQFDENGSILIHCQDHMRMKKLVNVKAAIKNAIRTMFAKPQPTVHGAFQTHMRMTYHFPLFWLLETQHETHLLHGAVVRINGLGIILSGLASVGKTTLTAFLYSNYPGTDILTDNFILYDSERIFAFPEASRLSSQGIEIASAQSLLNDAFILGHRYHWVPRKPDPFNTVPKKAFLVCLGKNLQVEPISSDLFADTALGLNDVVKEFHNYSYVSLFPFATRCSSDIYASRARALKSCLRNVECAVLTIPEVSSLADYHQEISELFH